MKAQNVVVLQGDSVIAQSLLNSLSSSFRSVRTVNSLGDLRATIARTRPAIVVIDIEAATMPEVAKLSREFPKTRVVCTHRLADDAMWTEALNAGAADVCPSNDAKAVLSAALRSSHHARSAAA
jgi:DNA-binding NarL/FixJ family response regulator